LTLRLARQTISLRWFTSERLSGTVTFLFTDIEGSTALLRRLGRDRYGDLLRRHQALLREVFAANRGEEIDTQGDGFFVAFRSATDAVAAAVDLQRALVAEEWPEGVEVRVRVGIHTGEAASAEQRYVGFSVHRAARIGSAAHGGQVLVSSTTSDLLEDDLPDDVSLRDLGLVRLKDIERPERLSQLVADGLHAEFPPLRGAEVVKPPPAWVLRRRSLLLAMLAGVVAAAVAVPIFALGGSGSAPSTIVKPDTVVGLDPASGKIVATIPVDSRPGPITAANGKVWVGNRDAGTVTEIDARKRQFVGTVPLPHGSPTGLAASAGRVWAVTGEGSTGNARGWLYRIDPQYRQLTGKLTLPGSPLNGVARGVSASGHEVWVANYDAHALRIDPAGAKVRETVQVGNQGVPGVAIGFGSTWVVSDGDATIWRLGPAGVNTPIKWGDEPSAIATGLGAVWVADRWDGKVAKIDPNNNSTEALFRVGQHPTGIAVGPGGVWVANSRSGTVSEINTHTNDVRTIRLGESPTGVVAADGLVWVTVSANPFAGSAAQAGAKNVARMERAYLEFDSLDPAVGFGSWQIQQLTCLKLINYPDSAPGTSAPLVAEAADWPTITDGGRTYTFKMRSGFRFSPPSNQPVTAATFERAMSPIVHGYGGFGYYGQPPAPLDDVVGARAYEYGKAAHVAGIVARGNTLTIHLKRPVPDLPARLALPAYCAVPIDTPPNPNGLPILPAAGPYYIAAHTLGERIVLKRNPNYRGSRPHHFAEIDIELDVGPRISQADVEAGRADYNFGALANPATGSARLQRLYGPASPAAKHHHQRWFENSSLGVDWLILNTIRPPFSSVRMRRALNFAIDRTALSNTFSPPHLPTDHYLPQGAPGYRNFHFYPLRPNRARASRLAGPATHRTVAVVTTTRQPDKERAQIVAQALEAIGLRAEIRAVPDTNYYGPTGIGGRNWDVGVNGGWLPNYLDPAAMLVPFDGRIPPGDNGHFNLPVVNSRFEADSKLVGQARYRAFGRLDLDIARTYAPVVAYGVDTSGELFSQRIGCQIFQPISYGTTDLAALCIRQ
jgi:YVTN family beta-propeller protein